MQGISQKQIEVHLKLYEGYVKHVNLIREQIIKLKESDTPAYVRDELRRRYSFEWNGARMHEYYFEQFEGAPAPLDAASPLGKKILEKFPSIDDFVHHVTEVATTRGIGWVVATYDKFEDTVHVLWVNDHEVGQLAGAQVLLALDMWEHAFMVDYMPAEKAKYVDAFFTNLNGSVVTQRFTAA